MKREIIIFYLKELRDLEVAKYKLNKNIENEKKQYYNFHNEKAIEYLSEVPKFNPIVSIIKFIFTITCFLIAAIFLVKLIDGFMHIKNPFDSLIPLLKITTVFSTSAILGGVAYIYGWTSYFRDKSRYNQIILKNLEEKERVYNNKQMIIDYDKKYNHNITTYTNDLNKVNNLLSDYYSLNIIPYQYRNIQSIIYIYDYMVSSMESLRDALFSNQLNDGISKILKKLDTIIENQGNILMSNRKIESNQQDFINQNLKMLNSLNSIEANSEESLFYNKLSAYYNASNAYFNCANYFDIK